MPVSQLHMYLYKQLPLLLVYFIGYSTVYRNRIQFQRKTQSFEHATHVTATEPGNVTRLCQTAISHSY